MTLRFLLGLQLLRNLGFHNYTLYLEGTQSLKIGINLEPLMMIVKLMTKLSKPQGSLKEIVLLTINNIRASWYLIFRLPHDVKICHSRFHHDHICTFLNIPLLNNHIGNKQKHLRGDMLLVTRTSRLCFM